MNQIPRFSQFQMLSSMYLTTSFRQETLVKCNLLKAFLEDKHDAKLKNALCDPLSKQTS